MWLPPLIVLLIIAGCVAYQYLKGTLVKAFATLIAVICAGIVAFAYFEALANVFISRGDSGSMVTIAPWAQMLSFILLFVLVFALLQTAIEFLTRQPVDLGFWPERVGRVVFGMLAGLILSGLLLTALAMAPLPNQYPYPRFDQRRPAPENPEKAFPNADGLATGLFSTISTGSFSSGRSFATLHADFIDQLRLNRLNADTGVSIVTPSPAIDVPRKNAAWLAPQGLRDSQGNPLKPKGGHNLIFVRVGIRADALKATPSINGGKFTLSQLRLLCKEKSKLTDGKPLAGKAKNVYPVGYLSAANRIETKRLNDVITLTRDDFLGNARQKHIDFAFYVPGGFVPVLLQFKQNSIAQISEPVTADQAPTPIPFIPRSKPEKNTADTSS